MFKQRVLEVVRKVKKGQTITYKEVATLSSNPNAARMVGLIMSKNKDKSVPCHRVIRSDGKLGGYNKLLQKEKSEILKLEGFL